LVDTMRNMLQSEQSRKEETARAVAVEKDDRINSLKLVKDKTLKGREWLFPLVVVLIIIVVVVLGYHRLRQSLLTVFFTALT